MEQRDHLKKQIDHLGRVLGKLLSFLLALKNQGGVDDGIEITNQVIKGELDLDLQTLIGIHPSNFIKFLKINSILIKILALSRKEIQHYQFLPIS